MKLVMYIAPLICNNSFPIKNNIVLNERIREVSSGEQTSIRLDGFTVYL